MVNEQEQDLTFEFNRRKRPSYRIVAETVYQRIRRGEYTGKIPCEQELVQEFHISRGTLRAGLALLENSGVISRRSGLGTFIISEQCHPLREAIIRLNNLADNPTVSSEIKHRLATSIMVQIESITLKQTN